MSKHTAFIGLDTHKETIAVALAEDSRDGEVRYYGQIANTPAAIVKLVKRLASNYGKLFFCYEAGPCGYGIQRQIEALGHRCVIIAPSHTPVKKGPDSQHTGSHSETRKEARQQLRVSL